MLPHLPRARLLELYRRMLLIRRFEEELFHLNTAGHHFGHFHLYIGQESIGVPALGLLDPDDYVATTFRNHGHLLARGADPGRLLAEIMGKATGYCRGKSGTLHVTARELGFLSTSAMVGGVIPIGTGAGFAGKQLGTRQVAVCCFGDGAMEEGAYFESVNLAALWALPVIYLCENNSLGAPGTKAGEYSSSTIAAARLTDLATAFRIPASTVDGTDARAVHQAMAEAIARARGGRGPSFIEAQVVRWPGSRPLWPELVTGVTDLAMAWDPARIPEAHAAWHADHDCLLRFTRELLVAGHLAPEGALALDREVCGEMARASAFALESPEPAPEAALEDVFAP
jgi:pyruvate dehydrogenase E1 component alpha subunit